MTISKQELKDFAEELMAQIGPKPAMPSWDTIVEEAIKQYKKHKKEA